MKPAEFSKIYMSKNKEFGSEKIPKKKIFLNFLFDLFETKYQYEGKRFKHHSSAFFNSSLVPVPSPIFLQQNLVPGTTFIKISKKLMEATYQVPNRDSSIICI